MTDSEPLTLLAAGEAWERAERSRRKPLANNTIMSYRDGWQSFCRWAGRNGRALVADLKAEDLGAWVDTLPVGKTHDGTLLTYGHGATAVCKFLAGRGLLPCELEALRRHLRDNLPRAYAPRAPDVPDLRRLVGFYDAELPAAEPGTRAERERLNALRNAALLHTLFSTGARVSEALALDVAGIRDDDGKIATRVYVTGKGERRRAVFIRSHAQLMIGRYLALRRTVLPKAEALFVSHGPRGAGQRLSRVTAWKVVTDASYGLADTLDREGRRREARDLREVTPHTFRHFVATWLLNEGAQLSEVSALLGHANTRITEQYYARHSDDRLQELHDQFSADPVIPGAPHHKDAKGTKGTKART